VGSFGLGCGPKERTNYWGFPGKESPQQGLIVHLLLRLGSQAIEPATE
jgi:hypothetical protein